MASKYNNGQKRIETAFRKCSGEQLRRNISGKFPRTFRGLFTGYKTYFRKERSNDRKYFIGNLHIYVPAKWCSNKGTSGYFSTLAYLTLG